MPQNIKLPVNVCRAVVYVNCGQNRNKLEEHLILALGWILFGFLHSLLASNWVKSAFQSLSGKFFHFYRFYYSVFAMISLAALLLYQYSFNSPQLFIVRFWSYFLILPLALVGIIFMGISIRKYFFYLSGIDVFFKRNAASRLDTGGIHQFVRHPLYFGTLSLVWAIFLAFPYANNLIAAIGISSYTLIGTFLEEKKLVAVFGESYREYKRRTPMIIPRGISGKVFTNTN